MRSIKGNTVPTVHARAVARAVELCGSEEALAIRLGVTPGQIRLWVLAAALPPDSVFLKVADILWEHALANLKLSRGDHAVEQDPPGGAG